MSAFFSRQCEYALQAVVYLALRPGGDLTPTNDLCRRLAVPYHFVAKILQSLVNRGILESRRGPRGGFTLATSPEHITLLEVVMAVDGDDFSTRCVMGFPDCSGKKPCAVHDQWGSLREGIVNMLSSKSIAQMAKEMRKPEYRRR